MSVVQSGERELERVREDQQMRARLAMMQAQGVEEEQRLEQNVEKHQHKSFVRFPQSHRLPSDTLAICAEKRGFSWRESRKQSSDVQ